MSVNVRECYDSMRKIVGEMKTLSDIILAMEVASYPERNTFNKVVARWDQGRTYLLRDSQPLMELWCTLRDDLARLRQLMLT